MAENLDKEHSDPRTVHGYPEAAWRETSASRVGPAAIAARKMRGINKAFGAALYIRRGSDLEYFSLARRAPTAGRKFFTQSCLLMSALC